MKRRRPPILLILFFLTAIAVVLFLLFVVQTNTRVLGAPGANVSMLNNLRYSFRLWRNLDALQTPVNFDSIGNETKFVIEKSDSAMDVCRKLTPTNPSTCDYMIYKGKDRTLSPGIYTLSNGLTPIQMVDLVSDSRNRDLQFTIFAGWRLEEIAAVIDQLGLTFDGGQFLAEARNPKPEMLAKISFPTGLSLEGRSLEGYFYPSVYSLKPSTTVEEFIIESVGKSTDNLLGILNTGDFVEGNYSLHERMILASIIQRETLDPDEMPLIASVFYNRLAIGMRLETDPTVQYGLGFDPVTQSWWKTPLTYTDLATPSDYNTYQISGLPPGPISNPGAAAVFAAMHPAVSEYFFFRAKCDGSLTHNFAITYEEHLANGCD